GATAFILGSSGTGGGTLIIGTAGTANTRTGLTTVNPTGVISINGGTFNANGDITINGGTVTQTTTAGGVFNWAGSHTMTVQAGGQLNVVGTYTTPANAVINVTGSGTRLNNNLLTGSANLVVTSGATLNVGGQGFIAPAGDITVSGGGTLNLTTSNGIGPLYWLGDGHTMAISSGGKVNFYGISGSFITSPSNAVINVTGAGSQLNANDNNGIYIYQGGQLNVTSGGAVAAGT